MFKFFRKKKLEVLPPEVQEKLDAEYERCYCNNWKNIVRMNGGKEFLTKKEYNYVMYTVIYYSLHKRYMAECKKVQEKIDAEYNALYGQKRNNLIKLAMIIRKFMGGGLMKRCNKLIVR